VFLARTLARKDAHARTHTHTLLAAFAVALGTCIAGFNYGTGSIEAAKEASNYTVCCDRCAAVPECKAWDWNPDTKDCYIKDNATPKVKASRWSGVMPLPAAPITATANSISNTGGIAVAGGAAPPVGPPSGPPPPQAGVAYDDSSWELVDAPHDMLINQACVALLS
jgi:hypothetical protein